ncbi:MAG: hypothetical protein LBT86_06140 [Deltaproteobacteria bacterium]|jgi:hypothetical protein|nr:hypothetical protein [Deltaproteobacteria bacterium]
MNAYQTINLWIENDRSIIFKPLSESGESSVVVGDNLTVNLLADPNAKILGEDDGAEDPVYLYASLVSIADLSETVERAVIEDVAIRNRPGELPTGFSLFYNPEDDEIYLGGQFLISAQTSAWFERLSRSFCSYSILAKKRLEDYISELATENEGLTEDGFGFPMERESNNPNVFQRPRGNEMDPRDAFPVENILRV